MTGVHRVPRDRWWWASALLCVLSVLLVAVGACIGSVGFENVGPALWAYGLQHLGADALAHSVQAVQPDALGEMAWQIVVDIRLPRTLGAWCAGALLGLAGAIAQGLFRNPLADPYLLGSASGASLGVAVALTVTAHGVAGAGAFSASKSAMFSADWLVRLGLTGAAFVGAILAVLLTLALARGVQHTLRLLLAGVIVGVVLGALTSLLLLVSPQALPAMQAFMLGSTGFVGWTACSVMAMVWCGCWCVAWVAARGLDGLTLGAATAQSLGLPLPLLQASLVVVLALATGTAVAQTGLIAFVGLAAPHVARALAPCSHRRLTILASLMGGVLLAAADLLARWVIAPQELPVGLLTAIMGGGYLLWLMHQRTSLRGSA